MRDNQEKIRRLSEYVQGLLNEEDGKLLYERYKADLEHIPPREIFGAFYLLLQQGAEPKEILVVLDKVINVLHKGLVSYHWNQPEPDSFLDFLIRENQALLEKLAGIREILGEKDLQTRKQNLLPRIKELLAFHQHYLKKENILFPYLEMKMERFNGLSIMWSLHDVARAQIKKVISCLESEDCSEAELNAQIGTLFFSMHGLVKKEEWILFPAASEVVETHEWEEMKRQSLEYEFPFIQRPEPQLLQRPEPRSEQQQFQQSESLEDSLSESSLRVDPKGDYRFKSETGELEFDQLVLMLNALPVDLTFVDENNQVKYFTRPKDRIFPRSPAIIGRNVDKCHPPESVHVVHKIIDAFRAGTKDTSTFWINVKGRMILIQYFALRNADGVYKGVLEASQDITEIQSLEGERRLLRWED